MPDDTGQAAQAAQAGNYRDEPGFKDVTRQLREERESRAQVEAKLQEIMDAQEKARKDKELKELEDKQQYEQVVQKLKLDLENQKKAHEKHQLDTSLQMALLKEGCSNDVFLRGALAGYTGDHDGIEDYVSGLKSSNEQFFRNEKQTATAATAVSPATSTSNNWEQVKANLKSTDLATMKQARAQFQKHVQETGQIPPGF